MPDESWHTVTPLRAFTEGGSRHDSLAHRPSQMSVNLNEDIREILLQERHDAQDRVRSIHIAFTAVFSDLVQSEKRRDRQLSRHVDLLKWTEKKGQAVEYIGAASREEKGVVMDDVEFGRETRDEPSSLEENTRIEREREREVEERVAIGAEAASVSNAADNMGTVDADVYSPTVGAEAKKRKRKLSNGKPKSLSTSASDNSRKSRSNLREPKLTGLMGEIKWLNEHAENSGFDSTDSLSTETEERLSHSTRTRTRTSKSSSIASKSIATSTRTISSTPKISTKSAASTRTASAPKFLEEPAVPSYQVLTYQPGEVVLLVNHYPELYRRHQIWLRSNRGRKRYPRGGAGGADPEGFRNRLILQCAKARNKVVKGVEGELAGKVFLRRNIERAKRDIWRMGSKHIWSS